MEDRLDSEEEIRTTVAQRKIGAVVCRALSSAGFHLGDDFSRRRNRILRFNDRSSHNDIINSGCDGIRRGHHALLIVSIACDWTNPGSHDYETTAASGANVRHFMR